MRSRVCLPACHPLAAASRTVVLTGELVCVKQFLERIWSSGALFDRGFVVPEAHVEFFDSDSDSDSDPDRIKPNALPMSRRPGDARDD